MLIALLVVFLVLSVVTNIWVLVIIFKRSILGGVLSLFFGLPILYFLVTGWGKEGQDIKFPFFLSFLFYAIAIAVGVKYTTGKVAEAMQIEMPASATQRTPAFREPAPATDSTRFRETPAAPAARPVAAPQAGGVPRPEAGKEAPRRPRAAQGNCVYKPVMTDEDMAKCR